LVSLLCLPPHHFTNHLWQPSPSPFDTVDRLACSPQCRLQVLVNSCIGISRVASVVINMLHIIATLIQNKWCAIANLIMNKMCALVFTYAVNHR
jgi:hypothetical protein